LHGAESVSGHRGLLHPSMVAQAVHLADQSQQIFEHCLPNIFDVTYFLIFSSEGLFSDLILYSSIYFCAISEVLSRHFSDPLSVGRSSSSHFVLCLAVLRKFSIDISL
jgi:hypothetical protein